MTTAITTAGNDRPGQVWPAPDSPMGAARVYAGALATSGGREVETLQRGGLAVALYSSPPYDVQVPAMAVARLSINLTPARVEGGLDDARPRAHVAQRYSLFLTPAGASAAWRKASPSRHINLYFDAGAFDGAGSQPLLNSGLTGARPLFDALAGELAQGDPFAAEAADSLARLILVRLARQRSRQDANPLSPALMARLNDFVSAHLDQRLLVADLAKATGLPCNRFALAFVNATGQSPHQYLLSRRLAHAVALLRHGSRPLAEVAAASGFASQQHMTQLMRSRLGQTPARLRAQ